MMNFKNEKGSITLFVAISCLFFLATVICIQMSMDSKQISAEREYRQVKANYEKDLSNADEIYEKLSSEKNIGVQFVDTVVDSIDEDSINISAKIIFNLPNIDVKELKYGWINSPNILDNPNFNAIHNWTYVESVNGFNQIIATLNDVPKQGYYYLCCMINNKEYWTPLDYVKNGLILHLDAINNLGIGDQSHSTTTTTWKDLSGNGNDAILRTTGENTAVWNSESLSFDGIDDYVTGSIQTNGDITVEFVGKNNNEENSTMYMLNTWESTVTSPTLQMFFLKNNGISNRLLVPRNSESNYKEIGGSVLGYFNKESNFVNTISKDSESIKVYINGVLVNQYTDQSFIDRFNITDISYTLGKWHSSYSYYSNQKMNSFRIYNRALTGEEVCQNYIIDKARFNIEN